ncbi:SixA phosphatase family protein [Zeaxanthinibacter enoshimensis]|uniref:Phosphohistidine phosphatase n=1 Tax=Zeaxanthinibacter enoshimensis TaxID=392009 RepID=A0A4R6TK50_9FLAO|nr:histidine phosphatase family protein [Zeaxanthinibacter enoshimensis]TDQ31007.1 phosphohistidine phosphatase [Zeaxanthinibacter enoshimensis]
MKNLIFVRHGKSAWNYDVNDKDRPLKERGINDGLLVSGKFKTLGITPDAIYSSPANRALHTCTIFLRKLKYDLEKFRLSEDLYEFSGEGVMEFVHNLDDSLETVMIFGHNYAFTNVVNQWGSESIDNVPTTGLVHLQFDIDFWKSAKQGKTVRTIFPKHLK